MRRDVEIADAGAIGQRDRDRRLQAALPPAGFQDVRDGAGAEGVALERAVDGGGRVPAGRSRRAARASRAVWTRSDSPRAARRSSSVATAGTARRSRSRALDGFAWRVAATRPAIWASCSIDLAGVVAAGVARDLLGAGDHAHGRRRSRAASAGGARGCAESSSCCGRSARTGVLPDDDGAHHVGLEGMRGQRQEPRLLLGEDLARRSDRAARDAGADARSRRASAETARSDRRHRRNVRAAKKAWRRY